MSGTIAVVAGTVALLALVLLMVTGYRAISTVPTAENPKPHLEGRRIARAFFLSILCTIAAIVFFVAGIVWVVEQFT